MVAYVIYLYVCVYVIWFWWLSTEKKTFYISSSKKPRFTYVGSFFTPYYNGKRKKTQYLQTFGYIMQKILYMSHRGRFTYVLLSLDESILPGWVNDFMFRFSPNFSLMWSVNMIL